VAELVPAERNARTHSPEQIQQIARSIGAFGWTSPILIDEARAIIAGHGRLEAARAAGLVEVPTIALAGLSAAQKRALAIADITCPPGENWSPSAPLSSASVVHPTERRKFTIAELRRICAFPDDYELTGSYADQWARCGNAVPPVMMFHIASALVPVLTQTERGLSHAA
jgi:site-specific DNA-cytosine methylase